jgi:glutamyl-tRNA synthetase
MSIMNESKATSAGKVKTRFAPSPTGMLHIGQVRTALYAYLVAKQNNGSFIFRLEDTDRERLVPGSAENIKDTLKWLGLDWDEGVDKDGPNGPYIQSERLEIYKKYAGELIEKGFAYQKDGAIWFKTNKEGTTSWMDIIGNKKIEIDNGLQDDFVMIKSDGYPTYNFAVVIDDHLMEITHVIRGVEFISSTPKHIMIFQAFGWDLPQFVHLPLILGPDRSKLSKRHGAKPAWEFKLDGYLPEAILNFMAILSWTPKSGKEVITLLEMVKEFDLNDVHVNNAIFDFQKLEWMNGEYIRMMSDEELTKRLQEYLVDHPNKDKIVPLVPLVKERIKKLSDFVPLTDFIFEKPEYEKETFDKVNLDGREVKEVLNQVLEKLQLMKQPWDSKAFETTFRQLADGLGLKAGSLFQLIRVAVSGQTVTPPLFESIELIGEDKTIDRIQHVIKSYPNFN